MANYQPHPQYQQYPPSPPPQRSYKVLTIVFCTVVALIVVGGGAFIVSRFAGGSGDDATGTTAPSASRTTDDASTRPSEAPSTNGESPSSQPSQPAASPPASSAPATSAPSACGRSCLPGVTLNGVTKRLQAKGFVCKFDRILGMRCEKGMLEVGIRPVYKQTTYVESIDVGGRATGSGNYPEGPGKAHAALQAGLSGVLPLFITDATARQQIVAFTAKNSAHAATGPEAVRNAKVGGFRLSCHGISGATVGKNGRSSSSYSTSVDIYSASEY
ncbi:hypothetical protein [Kribbella sp. CA-293567]|uniref:hypothetical protein n=1 Tax=Kribbella sp. CA-293567 TaxID=3002436 RepID=UPI0022DD0331|nr:hypothetical protein [Kribbella sp. CA-293567]WBQ06600.1 hypothetical protein OX958_07330 [Kribbella sp. CA-293567]